jgi:ketosteroid isomerase-like protein
VKLVVALVVLAACAAHPERDVNDALAAYRMSIAEMNVDATVALFAPSASISHAEEAPVIGRPAIGAFLRTFSAYHVTTYQLDAESTRVNGELAAQHGHYHQEVQTPDGQHVTVDGVFDASWKLQPDGHWRITRMHTAPR